MAYKQPRVPQLRQGTQLKDYVYELVLFLKDFCMETWIQIRNLQGAELPDILTQETVRELIDEQAKALLDEQARALRQEMAEASAAAKKEAIDSALPVGIVVKFATAANPNALYPWHTWTQITDGRVEIAANGTYPLGSTGGEAAHTLTTNEMPAHAHSIQINIQHSDGTTVSGEALKSGLQVGGRRRYNDITYYAGGGAAHNNMQPYVARNVWQRTA